MKHIITILFFALALINGYGQGQTLKEQALEEFKKEHYNEAISLLEQAIKQPATDAEIFYYLGWFNHYRAYDSRPLSGYDFSYSERIFKYLDKALELNPNYGDAKYFYGAECSGNAFVSMQNYNLDRWKYFYKLANDKGAYPAWLKEFGRNFLNSCDENAILFTGGNADFDICSYLQLHENLRTDITLIPIGNIDRPWYVQFLKKGLKGGVRNINIKLTDQQIMDIHPFKWDSTIIPIQVSPADIKHFGLHEDYQLNWEVLPDLFSERMHSKIEGEKAKPRTYLSPQRAILLQIVENNFVQRPIYFSNFCSPVFYGGLNTYFQNVGLVSKLTPIKTKGTNYVFDDDKIRGLFNENNLKDFKTLTNNDIPRISGMILSGYYMAMLHLSEGNNKEERLRLKNIFEKHLKIGFNKEFEKEIENAFEK